MKLVHCITGLSGDGAQRMLLRLVGSLRNYGALSIVVNLGKDDGVARNFEDAGIRVWSLGLSPNPLGAVRGARALASIISAYKPDIVQGWMYHANLLALLARGYSRKKFVSFWNIRRGLDDYSERGAKTRCVIRSNAWLSKSVDRIVYCSDISRAQHEQFGFCSNNGVVLENGFDTYRFRPKPEQRAAIRNRYGIGNNEILIGNIGRYDIAKGHQYLIEAFGKLLASGVDARLIMIGRGIDSSNHELISLLERHRCAEQVILLGEQLAVENITPAFDIYCSSSISEGFPNAIAEALACAVPCVVTDTGASREIVESAGWIVEPRDPQGLSRALALAIQSGADCRMAMGKFGRERIENSYGLKSITERYYSLYDGAARY